ncbi:MAG: hypothetical protein ACD_58C00318G0002 [uncultured bacterium]|nr:MAG: hypothetical protein ACD_58C00318G0002 [uncultured bacterium]
MERIRHLQSRYAIISNRKIIFQVIAIFFSLFIILSLTGATCNISGGTIQDLLGTGDPTKLTTDVKSMRESITQAVWNVTYWLIAAATSIGTMYFMINGFFYMTSFGDKEKIEKAKKGMLWSIIGVLILLTCIVVAKYVFNDVLELQGKFKITPK